MVRREALNWLKEALADFRRASRSFEDGDYALSTFMAQQACEKAFKAAYLALARSAYPKTNDLVLLYNGLSQYLNLPEKVVEYLPEVSQYYTIARYPNAGLELPSESISKGQASRAIRIAKAVVTTIERRIKEAGDP